MFNEDSIDETMISYQRENAFSHNHCVKSVLIRSFSGSYFPAFGLNTERYFAFSLNAGKYGPEKLRIQTRFTQ